MHRLSPTEGSAAAAYKGGKWGLDVGSEILPLQLLHRVGFQEPMDIILVADVVMKRVPRRQREFLHDVRRIQSRVKMLVDEMQQLGYACFPLTTGSSNPKPRRKLISSALLV